MDDEKEDYRILLAGSEAAERIHQAKPRDGDLILVVRARQRLQGKSDLIKADWRELYQVNVREEQHKLDEADPRLREEETKAANQAIFAQDDQETDMDVLLSWLEPSVQAAERVHAGTPLEGDYLLVARAKRHFARKGTDEDCE